LQTASNPYATIIGPIESAATRISIMGICNKVAGILASLIFGYIALNNTDALEASLKTMDTIAREDALNALASRVVVPYSYTCHSVMHTGGCCFVFIATRY
jgi:FHS family L-fucose permease-like MFS transporter